jgi:Rps23 Pro-64 3,4-dihydroxylase Tpa1-like proline 4-hydroxylase
MALEWVPTSQSLRADNRENHNKATQNNRFCIRHTRHPEHFSTGQFTIYRNDQQFNVLYEPRNKVQAVFKRGSDAP